jgi:hypothetical protein
VSLAQLPDSRPSALSDLVAGPVLFYGESSDPQALVQSVRGTNWFAALAQDGVLRELSLSRQAATLSALAQRLNDLSRSPIGDEAVVDVLDGPLALALRPNGHGDFDVLLIKALSPRARNAWRLAEMLEAVHPSAQQVRVDRYDGIPVRQLRLDGERRLHYFVLRDRAVFSTDPTWVRDALDLALGTNGAQPAKGPWLDVRERSRHALAWAALDADVAEHSGSLGWWGRALSGLSWAALRWSERSGLELGVRKAHGGFSGAGPPLALPPGALVVIAREVPLNDLLALPPTPPNPSALADGGASPASDDDSESDSDRAGRELLQRMQADTESGAFGPHVLYALLGLDAEGPFVARQALLLEQRDPTSADATVKDLVPRLLKSPPQPHDEPGLQAACAGTGTTPWLCFADLGPYWGLATELSSLRAVADVLRPPNLLPESNAISIYLDPATISAELARTSKELGRGKHPPAEHSTLEALAQALSSVQPLRVDAHAVPGDAEAWGRWIETEGPRRPGAP